MSNILPQRPALNRQIWERLEQTEIKEYAPRFRQIWVIDGPIFHNRNRLRGGEEIPDACFKIIVREEDGRPSVLAFIMPQTVIGTESAQQYLSSIDEIEKETGLDFFSMMPTDLQQRFEMETARGMMLTDRKSHSTIYWLAQGNRRMSRLPGAWTGLWWRNG